MQYLNINESTTLNDAKKKFLEDKKVSKEDFDKITSDTANGYVYWVCREFTDKKNKNVSLLSIIDTARWHNALKQSLPTDKKDIYKMDYREVENLSHVHVSKRSKRIKAAKDAEYEIKWDDGSEDGNVLVQIKNFQASVYFGWDFEKEILGEAKLNNGEPYNRGVRWCISTRGYDGNYNNYAKNGPIFFMIMPKESQWGNCQDEKHGKVKIKLFNRMAIVSDAGGTNHEYISDIAAKNYGYVLKDLKKNLLIYDDSIQPIMIKTYTYWDAADNEIGKIRFEHHVIQNNISIKDINYILYPSAEGEDISKIEINKINGYDLIKIFKVMQFDGKINVGKKEDFTANSLKLNFYRSGPRYKDIENMLKENLIEIYNADNTLFLNEKNEADKADNVSKVNALLKYLKVMKYDHLYKWFNHNKKKWGFIASKMDLPLELNHTRYVLFRNKYESIKSDTPTAGEWIMAEKVDSKELLDEVIRQPKINVKYFTVKNGIPTLI